MNYDHDYIVPGDIFADESVLCMMCATPIATIGYKEMPKINDSKTMVNVAHKVKLGNYRQVPVLLYRRGKESIAHLLVCQGCVKEVQPELNSEQIVGQIVRGFQIELRWAGYPDEAVQAVKNQWADARILRRLTGEEALKIYSREN